MPEASGLQTDLPAPLRPPHEGSAAGRQPEAAGPHTDQLSERVHAAAGGLERMVAQAEAVQRERAEQAQAMGAPRWTDVFTTQFTEFSNRPR